MSDWKSDRIGSALRGENPTVLARLPASFAVIGDVQWLPGYSVLDALTAERREERYRPAPALTRLVWSGRLGRQTGAGFFVYDE